MSACCMQVFCHFQTNETSSYDHGPADGVGTHIFLDTIRVIHVPEGKDTFRIYARQRRFHGIGPG